MQLTFTTWLFFVDVNIFALSIDQQNRRCCDIDIRFPNFRSIGCISGSATGNWGWTKEYKVGTPDQKRQQPLFLCLVASGAPFG